MGTTSNHLATSPDGITWTARTVGFTVYEKNALAFGNSVFAVRVGAVIYTSADGATWVNRGTPSITPSIGPFFAKDRFVIGNGSGQLMSSTDGITWSAMTNPSGGSYYLRTATGGNGSAVVGLSNNYAYHTRDFSGWDSQSLPNRMDWIAYGAYRFAALNSGTGANTAYATVPYNYETTSQFKTPTVIVPAGNVKAYIKS